MREFIARTLVDDPKRLIRRELMEEIEKQVTTHSLVFVVGDGGSGKSVLAAQFLKTRPTGGSLPPRSPRGRGERRAPREGVGSPVHPTSFCIEELAETVARLRMLTRMHRGRSWSWTWTALTRQPMSSDVPSSVS